MATPKNTKNIGTNPNSIKNRFQKGHNSFKGIEKTQFKKGIQNNPNGGFKKGQTPWNKGQAGVMPVPWNKDQKGLQVAWNKGQAGVMHHSEEAKQKIRERRATQVFPLPLQNDA